jgi:hypothetical protein
MLFLVTFCSVCMIGFPMRSPGQPAGLMDLEGMRLFSQGTWFLF